jgi:hypothetical protein
VSSESRVFTEPAYPAARAVAVRVQPLFAGEHEAAGPAVEEIEAIVNAAFWASLRRIEGFVPTISLAYVSPAQSGQPLMLDRPVALDPDSLARLAPAVERQGIHLGAWRDDRG